MGDFKWHFGNFTSEMQNTAYRHFIKTDREYRNVQYYLNKHENRFYEILNGLDEKDKKFIMEYIDKESLRASCSSNEMYISGYRDCVMLLRELGAL
ncbi:hypothetical protein [Wukongibacter sp. M2B1]|uniref:hypothetical protein n=1 Tax=Wukongibacter sp. M2B1 TaxID=3088895 RepID=UPI003D791DD9